MNLEEPHVSRAVICQHTGGEPFLSGLTWQVFFHLDANSVKLNSEEEKKEQQCEMFTPNCVSVLCKSTLFYY